jgi:hypothetical protein
VIPSLAHTADLPPETLTLSAAAIAGLLTGAAHVFAGPDHLAAVAPLATEQRRHPWLAGCLWGVGHSLGVWTLALLAALFRESLPVDALSHWSERLVGVVLIIVGVWGLCRVTRLHVHTHRHTHTDEHGRERTHEHAHIHTRGAHAHEHRHRPHAHMLLGIGAIHGVAGTAHLLGVLPVLVMPGRLAAIVYVLGFGFGSIAGMGIFTAALGMLAGPSGRLGRVASRGLLAACSAAAIGIGAFWLAASSA